MQFVLVCDFEIGMFPGLTMKVYYRGKKNTLYTQELYQAKTFDSSEEAENILDLLHGFHLVKKKDTFGQ